VLAAAESAARDAEAPAVGSATFVVLVFADNQVRVELANADADADRWARVGDSLARSLDARRVRVPPGARGWRVVVRVDAVERLADGRDVRTLHGPRAEVEPSALQRAIEGKRGPEELTPAAAAAEDRGGDSHEPKPLGGAIGPGGGHNAGAGVAQGLARHIVPTPAVSACGRVGCASASLTPSGPVIGGPYSLENIGASSARIVSGRILSESGM
jgi:hypothetical protein